MSTTTEVVPGAGWYRDPGNPHVARWWDGTAWGPQTHELPPAEVAAAAVDQAPAFEDAPAPDPSAQSLPATVDPGASSQAMIAVADPPAAAPEEVTAPRVDAKPRRGLPSFPRPTMPGNPLVSVLVVLVLLVGGWFAWKSLHGSPSAAAPPAKPVISHVASKPAARPVRLPRSAPSDLAGTPWVVDPATRSLAAHIVAGQKHGGHVVVASYYGQTFDDRFFFLASSVRPSDRKHVSTAVAKARLTSLIREVSGGDAFKSTSYVTVRKAGSPPVSCATGKSGTGSDVNEVSICSWQSPKVRVVVAGRGNAAATQLLLARVLTQLSR